MFFFVVNDVQHTFSDAISSDNFEKLYNRKKPTNDQEIIFSCRSGMRAGKAATMLVQLGYTKYVLLYRESAMKIL